MVINYKGNGRRAALAPQVRNQCYGRGREVAAIIQEVIHALRRAADEGFPDGNDARPSVMVRCSAIE